MLAIGQVIKEKTSKMRRTISREKNLANRQNEVEMSAEDP